MLSALVIQGISHENYISVTEKVFTIYILQDAEFLIFINNLQ